MSEDTNSESGTEDITELVSKNKSASKGVAYVSLTCKCGKDITNAKASGSTITCPVCSAEIKY